MTALHRMTDREVSRTLNDLMEHSGDCYGYSSGRPPGKWRVKHWHIRHWQRVKPGAFIAGDTHRDGGPVRGYGGHIRLFKTWRAAAIAAIRENRKLRAAPDNQQEADHA
ncbi:hypothetical protein [Oceanibaculum indicum]|uniref:Uncharacterized protein n=1 Tax=Oceanibaculum indicum TaxID=526216 RepID=A0A420WGR8_9PROT|nr:hypothetical protein [Oceanibaculum indicum]RKQ70166.1 hypothetical protein BCL74_2106 [Oceanibaculum indicum]